MAMICGLFSLALLLGTHVFAAEALFKSEEVLEGQTQEKYDGRESVEIYIPEDAVFTDDSEVFYYAYMDLNTTDESLKSKVLQARNIVIYNSSWVADGVNGYIEDKKTGTKRELPHFSEVFPSDWEMPIILTQEVD